MMIRGLPLLLHHIYTRDVCVREREEREIVCVCEREIVCVCVGESGHTNILFPYDQSRDKIH
jgi:6-phosphogluconolactonase/glucosamine-6-phosphate isomerase/deaminase